MRDNPIKAGNIPAIYTLSNRIVGVIEAAVCNEKDYIIFSYINKQDIILCFFSWPTLSTNKVILKEND